MGDFNSGVDFAQIHEGGAQIVGVATLEEAKKAAMRLQTDGVDCIELCGAFGEKGAREIIKATKGTVPIGYVTHLPEQNELYTRVFS